MRRRAESAWVRVTIFCSSSLSSIAFFCCSLTVALASRIDDVGEMPQESSVADEFRRTAYGAGVGFTVVSAQYVVIDNTIVRLHMDRDQIKDAIRSRTLDQDQLPGRAIGVGQSDIHRPAAVVD